MRLRSDLPRAGRRAAFALAALLLPGASPLDPAQIDPAQIDPLTIADDDFVRHHDPAEWRDLSVSRIVFTEGAVTWRLWRIANLQKPQGPLWIVTHDNENATFAAALVSLRAWGGVAMVVDTGPADTTQSARFNRATIDGHTVDPNRNFRESLPLYAARMLADLGTPPRLIIALHTNEPGFAPAFAGCDGRGGAGAGNISILLCTERFHPSPSHARAWPFDNDDTVALVPYLADRDPGTAWCGKRLTVADYNVVFERVAQSDGSLSNYAVQHGFPYVNIETEERGSDPAGIATARDRLVHVINGVIERCADIPGIALRRP